jgi:hypothetical protein
MKLIRRIAVVLVGLIAAVAFVALAARFMDGPLGPFPGGPLRAGRLVTDAEIDWAPLAEVREVELQLVSPPRSRTTWLLVHDGAAYVPCGLPNVRLLKQWPHEAMEDGRVVLRIDDTRYERHAVRVEDPRLFSALVARMAEKYGAWEDAGPDAVWFFRLDPRRDA